MNKKQEAKAEKPTEKEPVKAKPEPEQKEPIIIKSREEFMREALIYLRENVVHGQQKHIDYINRALGE